MSRFMRKFCYYIFSTFTENHGIELPTAVERYTVFDVKSNACIFDDFRYLKFIYLHCGEETKLRDPCS